MDSGGISEGGTFFGQRRGGVGRVLILCSGHGRRCASPLSRPSRSARRGQARRARRNETAGASAVSSALLCASRRRISARDRKSTRLNSSHVEISYAVFCLKKKKKKNFCTVKQI